MTLLVTGGAGFIGSSLIEKLLPKHRIVCLDNFDNFYSPSIKRRNISSFLNSRNFSLVEGDIRDRVLLERIFRENNFSKVVHLAAKAGIRQSIKEPQVYEDVNIRGTINLLEVVKDRGIESFVFASSSSVYGASEKLPFSEKDAVDRQISPYAASKKAGESFCYAYHYLYGIPITCLRFFTAYGSRQRPEMAIHKFANLIDEGMEIEVYGDGTTKRDYTYIDDVVGGISEALDKKFGFEIINIGNSRTVELKDVISLIEKNIGKKAKIKHLPEQSGDAPITCADISKAGKLLGYKPKTRIEDGIKKFVEWYGGERD